MNAEKISWWSDGLKIFGEAYSPAERNELSQLYPALIICHGIPAKVKDPADRGYPSLAERFCREGFFVLIFNFRGAGLSEGNFDILGWTRDLKRALDFLVCRPEVNQNQIFLMGFSGGAAVSIYVAAQQTEISAIISCASPAEFRELATGKGLKEFLAHAREVGIIRDTNFPPSVKEWQEGFQIVNPMEWVGRIPPRPLLIIHGTEDSVVDVRQARDLYDKVRGKAELFLVEDAGHRLRLEEQAMSKALDWLKRIAFGNQP